MSILTFIVVLLLIVLVHEFGHFIVAKKSGIRVDEFGFGFPPKLFGKKFGETEYTFNLLPIGGFVRIFGETPNEDSLNGPDSSRSFIHKPKWIQAAVLVAGVAMNFLLAWVIFVSVFIAGAPYSINSSIPKGGEVIDPKLTVVYIEPGSPAEKAGLATGDTIIWVRSEENDVIAEPTDVAVQNFIQEHPYENVTIAYKRGESELMTAEVVSEMSERLGRPAIGISMDMIGKLDLSLLGAVIEGTKTTGTMTVAVAAGLLDFFAGVFTGGADLDAVTGPVGIVGIVGDAAQLGLISVLILTAVISINLGIINLLPFPALDGGRLVFLGIEKVTGRAIEPRIANAINSAGFIALLLLMAIITFHDVIRLF